MPYPSLIIQAEPSGCGIACVATLAGVPYAEAKAVANRLGIYVKDEKLWSDTGYVRRLLQNFGIKATAKETPCNDWNGLPELALLAIKYYFEKGRPYWHWVVFCRRKEQAMVLDPAA